MTETVFTSETIEAVNDQMWRRLGISQTFDRLLVRAVAARPATPPEVLADISEGMGDGAARFLALTYDKLVKDLARRRVVARGEILTLDPEFAERLQALVESEMRGDSRIDPTPGVTLEEVNKRAAEREKRPAAPSTARPKRSALSKTATPTGPRTRRAGESAAVAATPTARRPSTRSSVRSAPAPAPAKKAAPANKLFTSRSVNNLLDCLDGTSMMRDQVGSRVGLRGVDLARFLEVCGELEMTRVTRDDIVELHWKGRELVRTQNADRRMALIEWVRKLREQAEQAEQAD